MPTCPRCDTAVDAVAVQCPHCGLVLKAHGHPGMPLHRTTGDQVLCTDCAYHADNSCTFPQRPHATSCTLYQSINPSSEVYPPRWSQAGSRGLSPRWSLRLALKRNGGWIALVALLMISLAIALS
ncbi:MAG: hypothetical protein O3C67_07070 [Cyanobacteria bacterium]|nr:hypothetical protein [Cyanobacteriota bacterium]